MSDEKPKHVSIARAPDAYEKGFMGVDEDIIVRDKMSWHPAFHAIMALATVAGIGGVIGSGAPLYVALLPLFVAMFAWSSITTLRTTVSTENVHVQYGLIGPTIPVSSIESAAAVKYNWWKYGGWGIRYSIWDNSWCYNMMGDGGRAVEVMYRKNGKLKKVLIASKEPNVLADAINRARTGELALPYEEEMVLDLEQEQDADEVEVQEVEAAEVEA